MSIFYFQVIDHAGEVYEQTASDFDTFDAAKADARAALGAIAAEGLPSEALNMMSVEIFDEKHKPLVELRLTMEEIPK